LYLCTPGEEGRQISGILQKPKTISNGAPYVTLDSKIKYLSLALVFLAIPLIKLKLHIDGRLLIENHLPKIQWRNRGGRRGEHYEKRNALPAPG